MDKKVTAMFNEIDNLIDEAEQWLWENNHIVDRFDPSFVEVLAKLQAYKQVKALAE